VTRSCSSEADRADNIGMSHSAPRVSVLIPNYNNGLASSCDGKTDLLGDLLESLHDTLQDDPTPLEIIAYDDGSTDDSLETLRAWSKKTWRGGQAFLRLIEEKHTGVLSIGANRLVQASTGDILVRLDGDTQMLTDRWASLLCQTFDQGPPRLGVIGPKQLRPDGKVHAFGDWLLHPKGYHHIFAGADRGSITQALEVDHVMGCFYCCKRAVYDAVGGYDESILRGQTIDFGLAARHKGWSCFAIPHIEYVHRHGLRRARDTTADTREGIEKTLAIFRNKWGFDRLSPDLDVVREKYVGSPMLWNAQVFGVPVQAVQAPGIDVHIQAINQSEWARYGADPAFKAATDLRVSIALQVITQTSRPEKIAVVGCGAGLITHMIAGQGHACIGTDPDMAKILLAQQCVAGQVYESKTPEYVHQADPRHLPLNDGKADLLLLFDQIERHNNPVALLREAHRVLTDQGVLVIITPRPRQASGGLDAQRCYRGSELMAQLNAIDGWQALTDPRQGDPNHPLIAIVKRVEKIPLAEPIPNAEPAQAA